ncbi:dephospho-CoA kinase [Enterococcus termitis]|uniref:Dephospho-CoA kinase n=1 Tax=Enterococcus termitis TaxID=332950 RepID=A0A1E5GQA2_9ENTE|nr:dephospho-CoA kinase [Enterococcus termitis]OEG14898.1 dephospho-CoA kinase [Enterococcus termitis]OJG96415.1 dephospho-CoA kinase [Enterococcus termitis]
MGMVLGLTGGIATGKSTVVDLFKKHGFPIVDADVIAREVVEIGTPGLAEIVSEFGSEMLLSDGSLNRKKLGALIFSDDEKRVKLNQLLSPFLRAAILSEIDEKQQQAKLVIVDIPLLYEGGYETFVDQVAVVYIPEELQLDRLMKRDNLTRTEAKQRVDSQLPIEQKRQRANIVFDNQKTVEETKKSVDKWISENIF